MTPVIPTTVLDATVSAIKRALGTCPMSVAGLSIVTDTGRLTIEAVLSSMHNAGTVRRAHGNVERWELTGDASSVQAESAGEEG